MVSHHGNIVTFIKIDGGQGCSPHISRNGLTSLRAAGFCLFSASQLSGEIVAKDEREEDVQIKDKNVTRT